MVIVQISFKVNKYYWVVDRRKEVANYRMLGLDRKKNFQMPLGHGDL